MSYRDQNTQRAGAFVDRQLSSEETAELNLQRSNDESLNEQIEVLQQLKQDIRKSYAGAHSQHYHSRNSCTPRGSLFGRCKQAVAAVIVLLTGLVIAQTGALTSLESLFNPQSHDMPQGFTLAPVTADQNKLLLHLSSSDPRKLQQTLDEAEYLLNEYRASHHSLQLEVVANSNGLDLLRSSTSPYAKRIEKLQQAFDNIQFIACVNTINRLQHEGKSTTLLPGVAANQPVVDKIIGRIQQGWTYIKI